MLPWKRGGEGKKTQIREAGALCTSVHSRHELDTAVVGIEPTRVFHLHKKHHTGEAMTEACHTLGSVRRANSHHGNNTGGVT